MKTVTGSPFGGRLGLLVGLLCLVGSARADNGTITLTAFPNLAVADGRTPITINAEVRDSTGRLAPDGTQVFLETSLGRFEESIYTTRNGLVRARLTSSPTPGLAKITATATTVQASGVLDFEFVSDRSRLDSAKEYFEIVCRKYLAYSPEQKLIAAAAQESGVKFRYRDIEIEADDLQVDIRAYRVRGRKVKLRLAQQNYTFDEMSIDLRKRAGWAVGLTPTPLARGRLVRGIPVLQVRPSGAQGLLEFDQTGVRVATGSAPFNEFKFEDITQSQTQVNAKRIVCYPQRDIQFSQAVVYFGDSKVLRTALYQMRVSEDVPALSDQTFNITGNQLAIDYPYYLSLAPGSSSLVRFRTGSRYSSGTGVAGGTFLDYELKWNRGNAGEGGVTLAGLARSDWGVVARHFIRMEEGTNIGLTLDAPAHRSLIGGLTLNRPLGNWQFSYDGSHSRNLRGPAFRNWSNFVTLEHRPIRLFGSRVQMFYGLTAQSQSYRDENFRQSQETVGLRTRFQPPTCTPSRSTDLVSTASFSQRIARGSRSGLTTSLFTTIGSRLSNQSTGSLGYEFYDDGFSARFLGRHRVNAQLGWASGMFSMSFFGSRALDRDRSNVLARASYRISPQWRASTGISWDRFQGSSFSDSSVTVGYALGIREVGLSYSTRTRRLGIELLGTSFP